MPAKKKKRATSAAARRRPAARRRRGPRISRTVEALAADESQGLVLQPGTHVPAQGEKSVCGAADHPILEGTAEFDALATSENADVVYKQVDEPENHRMNAR